LTGTKTTAPKKSGHYQNSIGSSHKGGKYVNKTNTYTYTYKKKK
jgi:hypothetical protein